MNYCTVYREREELNFIFNILFACKSIKINFHSLNNYFLVWGILLVYNSKIVNNTLDDTIRMVIISL